MCALPYFGGSIENESVDVFYKDIWGNSITICKENEFEGNFVSYGVMFENFPCGGWPYGYRVEKSIHQEDVSGFLV